MKWILHNTGPLSSRFSYVLKYGEVTCQDQYQRIQIIILNNDPNLYEGCEKNPK